MKLPFLPPATFVSGRAFLCPDLLCVPPVWQFWRLSLYPLPELMGTGIAARYLIRCGGLYEMRRQNASPPAVSPLRLKLYSWRVK